MFDFHIISRPLEKDIQPHFESMADIFIHFKIVSISRYKLDKVLFKCIWKKIVKWLKISFMHHDL